MRDVGVGKRMPDFSSLDARDDPVHGRMRHWILSDDGNWRGVAPADARRMQNAHVRAEDAGQRRQQLLRPRELARDRIADAHRDRWWGSVAFFHDIEMMVEGRHFVHFGHRHLHFGGERNQMRRRKTAKPILNEVQVLDQEIAAARGVAEQRRHLLPRFGVNRPTFRDRAHPSASAFGMGHWTD